MSGKREATVDEALAEIEAAKEAIAGMERVVEECGGFPPTTDLEEALLSLEEEHQPEECTHGLVCGTGCEMQWQWPCREAVVLAEFRRLREIIKANGYVDA